ncbi:hypothetical protein GCM10010911_02650 [Paenibacillus nasutitermitis]|uniref:Uncharacterized protein n=1 Tax=Paenibacillus nasutitermitis TaxID=1652958 RepID=A0A917DKV0_9BACL|nr:hypothetical protein GCM10010911_02650 [Paenibacillus nasutitermitis]
MVKKSYGNNEFANVRPGSTKMDLKRFVSIRALFFAARFKEIGLTIKLKMGELTIMMNRNDIKMT